MFPNTPADAASDDLDVIAAQMLTQNQARFWWQLAKMRDIAADLGWVQSHSDDH